MARIDAAPAVPAPTEAEIAQAWATYSQQQRIGKPMVAAFVLDMLAKYAATAASAGGPAGDTYLCKAWGETDLPAAAIVVGMDGVRDFLVSEWLGSADDTHDDGTNSLEDALQDMQEQWLREGEAWEWSIAFELGGVSVQKVGCASPAPAAQAGCTLMPWRCFHCDEKFDDHAAAAEHFGTSMAQEPACQIDITTYREMESLVRQHVEEDTDLHREIARLQCEHATALIREEEKGYARGLQQAAQATLTDNDLIEIGRTHSIHPDSALPFAREIATRQQQGSEAGVAAPVCIGEFVCGEVQFGVDGPECGDYEIIYTNGLLDQVNEGHQGKSFGIYIDRAALVAENTAATEGGERG
ncbi:hypothetical protein [Cupriavidus metallidurans]|uniref:hypothetical protein n=1 Tax=Cupriavidus metallidurans TaxID=119219 RepID=UPI0023819641|nr:hypothetical protein [Cupriavidus metallidurans]MDE4922682.1 hypothetical protein [Cupriavidus metallidurans]